MDRGSRDLGKMCNRSTRMIKSYQEVKKDLLDRGFKLLLSDEEYHGVTRSPLICQDDIGYRYLVTYDAVMRGGGARNVHHANPFSIDNINLYLKINNIRFECISERYIKKKEPLIFKCLTCGSIITSTWDRVNRNGESRNHLVCSQCGKRGESLHALVLKQMFLHYYPDTIVEDPTFRSGDTGKIRPTDIVNHRLKIAVEIQSQWHDFDDIKKKDEQKRQFWLNKGYNFYDPDIQDYTVLEMCQLFFDIDQIPDFIDYHYSDGINARLVQQYLDDGKSISEICSLLKVSSHQIWDAEKTGKIHYPEFYSNCRKLPVAQYDANGSLIAKYQSISEAARVVGCNIVNLTKHLRENKPTYHGYVWAYI